MDRNPEMKAEHPQNIARRTALGILLGTAAGAALGFRHAPSAAAAPAATTQLTDALRRITKPSLTFTQVGQVTGPRHRVTFHHATWTGGDTYVRDLDVKTAAGSWVPVTTNRFDEQWVVLTGDFANTVALDYYNRGDTHWVAFGSCSISGTTATLQSTLDDVGTLTVTWDVAGDNPVLTYTVTPVAAGNVIVGYAGYDGAAEAGVREVLCGALQHAKVIKRNPYPLAAWELFAPVSLTERTGSTPLTVGTFIPADVIAFEHERYTGPNKQWYAMSLRNDSLDVVPTVFAPALGDHMALPAGTPYSYAFGLCAYPGALTDAYEDLLRTEYSYTAYRSNVYEASLTDAVHNLTDLVMTGPSGDDSTDFVPSYSGWWSRAKGFADIENQYAVRTPTTAVLLSAHYLTSAELDEQTGCYPQRARPGIEYQLSRPNIGSSPVPGTPVYGTSGLDHLYAVPGDAVNLNALYQLTRGENPGLHTLGVAQAIATGKTSGPGSLVSAKALFSSPLAAWKLTGDPTWLNEAMLAAKTYAERRIDTAYTDADAPAAQVDFAYHCSRLWVDLVAVYEHAQELLADPRTAGLVDAGLADELLASARTEARRFITQTEVRPVDTTGTIAVPASGDPVVLHQFNWPDHNVLPSYPGSVVQETRPKWWVSTNGLTFEQLSTFKIAGGGGLVMNPCWAGFLLRLSRYADDPLLGEFAHNQVIGRFTNYPGYYSRQFSLVHLKPDFPLTGPPGVTEIYFHHIPAQLGLALDYLFSEHEVRTDGAVRFPREFESNYVYFSFSLYGHRPGTFYGDTGVWPYLPKHLISVSNAQFNWLSGVGNGKLYVSVTNSSTQSQSGTVSIGSAAGPYAGQTTSATVISGGVRTSVTATNGSVPVTVPARGAVGVIFDGVTITRPWQRTPSTGVHTPTSYATNDAQKTRGILLVRPDRGGYDAYVQVDTLQSNGTSIPATLTYQIDGGTAQTAPAKPYPYEWTIPVASLASTFTYQVSFGSTTTTPVTLRLPLGVTGTPVNGQVTAELDCGGTAPRGGQLTLKARAANGTSQTVTGVSVTVAGPSGAWPITTVTALPATLGPGQVAEATYTVTIPAGAGLGSSYQYTGTLSWQGGGATATPASIVVRDPLRVLWLEGAPQVIAKPGESTVVTAYLCNPGPIATSSTAVLTGQAGWSIDQASKSVTLPANATTTVSWTVTSPVTAAYQASYQFRCTLDGNHSTITQLQIPVGGLIVHNGLAAPRYVESAGWTLSGLNGWDGRQSRFALSASCSFNQSITTTGVYDIAVWFPTDGQTTTDAQYIVAHAAGQSTVHLNQRDATLANRWTSLGQFTLTAGSVASVGLSNATNGIVRSSAVRFLQT
jgi:hypothetical protein